MQEVCSSHRPVITGIFDPNKSRARCNRSLKLCSKLKYLDQKKIFWRFCLCLGSIKSKKNQEQSDISRFLTSEIRRIRAILSDAKDSLNRKL